MVRFLPSPFNNKATGVVLKSIDIVDSELFCEKCGEATDHGTYIPDARRLTFVCPSGHDNVIRGLDLD